MATHSNILTWRIPWTEEATVHGVAKIRTQLKQLMTLIDLAASGLSCGVQNLVASQNVGS